MKGKRLVSMLLVLILVLGMIPYSGVWAAATSGSCGDNATWSFDEATGTLTISGTGEIWDFFNTKPLPEDNRPWRAYQNDIKAVAIKQGITRIGKGAFDCCENLTSVTLPNSLEVIGPGAFENCTNLTSITIPDNVTALESGAFAGCAALTDIAIPDSVTSIGDHAFSWCERLSSISIPDGVTSIESWTFNLCDNLTSVTLSDNITSIGEGAFAMCRSLSSIKLPHSVTTIDSLAFAYCDSLTAIIIPASVTSIVGSAFGYCEKLSKICFEGDAPSIGACAFEEVVATAYYPDGNSTWSEAVMLDYYGQITWVPYTPNPFTDVPADKYYHDPVLWAYKNGITTGTSATTFSPDRECTRGQIVTFLWRAAGEPEPTTTNNPFTDVEEDDFYYKAVLWAVEKGITNGATATTFNPKGSCTRAQVVTFMWRAAGEPTPTSANNPFTDVPEGKYYHDAVLWAVENGITNGTSPTKFSPNNICNRGQIVTFLYRGYAD